jgi:surface protein
MKHLILVIFGITLLFSTQAQKDSTHFVTTWRTFNNGYGGDSTVVIHADTSNFTYNFDVDWDDDGVFDSLGITKTVIHTYGDTGTYTIRIRGQFPYFLSRSTGVFQNLKIISIDQWGTTAWESLNSSYAGCELLQINASDLPNMSLGPNCQTAFLDVPNAIKPLENLDVSKVKIMSDMFGVSFVTPTKLVVNLNGWDTDSVEGMSYMFSGRLDSIICDAWDVSNVKTMAGMFAGAENFNSDISGWNVSNVKEMRWMFQDCQDFNQDISLWQVDSVTTMSNMFNYAFSFDQDLTSWNVSSVTDMSKMFYRALGFNNNLGQWNISSVTDMKEMFDETLIPLSFLNVLRGKMTRDNYDSTLIGWQLQVHNQNVELGAINLKYCAGATARTALINDGWIISGDALDCLSVGINEISHNSQTTFKLYPNPTKENFILERSYNKAEELIIYDLHGKIVHQQVVSAERERVEFLKLISGLYLVRVGEESKRLVVK